MHTNRIYKKICLILISSLFVLIGGLLLFKNTIFDYVIENKISQFNNTHIGKIFIKTYKLNGLSRIDFDSIYFISPYDTIGKIDTLSITIKPFKLILGDIVVKEIFLQNTYFNLCKYDSIYNFSTLFKRKNKDTSKKASFINVDYNERASLIFKALFDILPEKGFISNINVTFKRKENDNIFIEIPFVKIFNYKINFPLIISDKKYKQSLLFANLINTSERTIYSKVINKYNEKAYFPGFEKIKLKAHFDTAFFSIKQIYENEKVLLNGRGELVNLFVNQPDVSFTDISFEKLGINYMLSITKNAFILDSASQVHFNKISFNPFIKFQIYPTHHLNLKINKTLLSAEDFFASLPKGLFPNTYGIKAKGNLSYKLYFDVDFSLLDSLKLDSELKPENLKIYSFGNINLAKLDSDFVHTVYENGEPIDNILISYSNPNYIPLQHISPYLRNALLCTEDGAFYWHKGFIQEAFKDALIQNLKRKKFVRGGSTITMQLVKNLYLNKYKTISRKLEEMLIVWIIENLRLCSKDRMFEIYLNIIEFGPKVYGVSKACKFYFNKKPSELTLPEAIFMASIVPKPKHFASSFDSTGTLKPAVQDFLKFVANRMLTKKMITQTEYDAFKPHVEIKGIAKMYLNTDSISLDELLPPIDFIY